MRKLLAFLLFTLPALAQSPVIGGPVQYVLAAPSGSCGAAPPIEVLFSNGLIYTCDNGTWANQTSGGGPPTGTAGGDLSGTYPNPTVAGFKSVPFCTGYTPTNGQSVVLTTASSPNPCYTAVADLPLAGGPTVYITSATAGADISQKIATGLAQAYALSPTSAEIYVQITGAQTWSENPWAAATNYPTSGTLHFCGVQITENLPMVMADYWSKVGCAPNAGGGSNSVELIASATNFPQTYTTGTVTFGTAGYAETVTGVGTTWTANMAGCWITAPATNPTATNSSTGIIHSVNSATSITLGWGINSGTGAAGGSGYVISHCPLSEAGDGYMNSSAPNEYGMSDQWITYNANNVPGAACWIDGFGQEGVFNTGFNCYGFTDVGMARWSNYAQNSGPLDRGIINVGSSCTANAIPYSSNVGGVGMKPFQNTSINSGTCSTKPNVNLDIQSRFEPIDNNHIESAVVGIGVGLNTSGVTSLPFPNITGDQHGVTLTGNGCWVAGTTCITLSNVNATQVGTSLRNNFQFGLTNLLVDIQNSCTDTNLHLASYNLSDSTSGGFPNNGFIQDSTSASSSCQASPTENEVFANVFQGQGGNAAIVASPGYLIANYGVFIGTNNASVVNCSTSGTAIFNEIFKGDGSKKVVIHLAACLGTASYTYPNAFTNTPSVFASNNVAAGIATSVSTTAVTVTGTTTTGALILEDF